jgi:hypothetical protein
LVNAAFDDGVGCMRCNVVVEAGHRQEWGRSSNSLVRQSGRNHALHDPHLTAEQLSAEVSCADGLGRVRGGGAE